MDENPFSIGGKGDSYHSVHIHLVLGDSDLVLTSCPDGISALSTDISSEHP